MFYWMLPEQICFSVSWTDDVIIFLFSSLCPCVVVNVQHLNVLEHIFTGWKKSSSEQEGNSFWTRDDGLIYVLFMKCAIYCKKKKSNKYKITLSSFLYQSRL